MFFDTDVSDIVLLGTNSITCWGRSVNASPRLRTLLGSNPSAWQQKARYRIGNGLLRFCGAPSGMSACGWRRPLSLRRSAPCVLRWKTLTRFLSSAPCRVRIPALEKKKPVTTRVTGFAFQMVPPAGFEPAISTLKGWRPWPLDDGDSGKEYSRLFCQRVYRWQTGKLPHRSRLLFRFSNISICNIWAGKSALSVTDRDRRRVSGRTSRSVTVRRLLTV